MENMGSLSKYFDHDREANIKNLTGDPKKAMFFLAIPTFFSLLVLNLNGIIDGFWVAGLGKIELDATAFFTPIYGSIIAVGNGIGIGAAAVIARTIAKGDRERANVVGGQVLLVGLIASAITMVIVLVSFTSAIQIMGGESILSECREYSLPIIIGCPIIILSGIIAGMLRGEGDGKRSLMFLASSVVFNLFLDPMFIYVFGWGLSGASTAMVVSASLSLCLAYHWYYVKQDTFVKPVFANIVKNLATRKEIMVISLPQTVELVSMAIFDMFTNGSVNSVGGADAVAVYTVMLKVLILLMIPAQAMASALIPVSASAIAQKDVEKLREGVRYSLRVSIALMVFAAILLVIFADYLVLAFSWSESTADMNGPMAHAVRICALAVPFMPLTFLGSAMLQVTGKGFYAASITIFRNILHLVLFAVGASHLAVIEYFAIWNNTDYFWFTVTVNLILCSLLMYDVAKWNYKRFTKEIAENKMKETAVA